MPTRTFTQSSTPHVLFINDNEMYEWSLTLGHFPSSAKVVNVGVNLVGLQHTYPDDLDFLLVGPRGTNLEFWSDAGGPFDIRGSNFAIRDSGASLLPDDLVPIIPGTYRPADYDSQESSDDWGIVPNIVINHPGPNSTASFASAFGGVPLDNSTWHLVIHDDAGGDVGRLFSWSLDITYSLPVTPDDFNGNGPSDVLLQNSDGTPMIWLMNGHANTTFAGPVGPFNPGPSWHIEDDGDFNGDGYSDILWQSADGTPAIWLMNGSNVVSNSVAGSFNPGPSWQIKASGDFNFDSKADILWQNNDGTPAIWLMDGANAITVGAVGPFNPGPS